MEKKARPHQCEWCEAEATFKLQAGDYRRYACDDAAHQSKVLRLAQLDGHKEASFFIGRFMID